VRARSEACVGLLKFILPLRYFGSTAKRTTYVGIARGRSAGKEIIAEFTLLGYLDVKINKGGLFWFLVANAK
jgi:hypothetical protein